MARATSRDVDEVASLTAVLEHLGCLAPGRGRAEDGGHPGVGGVSRHPRSVDVVVAKGDDRAVVLTAVGRAQMLLMELGGGVHVAGVERALPR